MADLRDLMTGLGYRDVRTLLNSGNVVFKTAPRRGDHASRIEKEIQARLGLSSRVTVLSAAELDVAIRGNTLLKVATHHSRLLVGALATRDDRSRLEPLTRKRWGQERLALGERVCYLWCPDGIINSPLMKEVGRALGDAITSRNWSTMQKLHGLLEAE
jgi:uncharacterized protein (DUF1697 family)